MAEAEDSSSSAASISASAFPTLTGWPPNAAPYSWSFIAATIMSRCLPSPASRASIVV